MSSAPDQSNPGDPASGGAGAAVLLAALRLYKKALSPVFVALGVRCRHAPTCSEYAMAAIGRHGAWRGGWMTLARLSRCHPLGSSGWDPAPETTADHRWRPWLYGDWAWTRRPAPGVEADQ
ncbi:MAG: membrane protein insertion efficiency factor YidD [Pseudomonadota bacterium]